MTALGFNQRLISTLGGLLPNNKVVRLRTCDATFADGVAIRYVFPVLWMTSRYTVYVNVN